MKIKDPCNSGIRDKTENTQGIAGKRWEAVVITTARDKWGGDGPRRW